MSRVSACFVTKRPKRRLRRTGSAGLGWWKIKQNQCQSGHMYVWAREDGSHTSAPKFVLCDIMYINTGEHAGHLCIFYLVVCAILTMRMYKLFPLRRPVTTDQAIASSRVNLTFSVANVVIRSSPLATVSIQPVFVVGSGVGAGRGREELVTIASGGVGVVIKDLVILHALLRLLCVLQHYPTYAYAYTYEGQQDRIYQKMDQRHTYVGFHICTWGSTNAWSCWCAENRTIFLGRVHFAVKWR